MNSRKFHTFYHFFNFSLDEARYIRLCRLSIFLILVSVQCNGRPPVWLWKQPYPSTSWKSNIPSKQYNDLSNTEINLRAILHFLTKGIYFSSTCQKIFIDVSEFDPEFKVRMHSAAVALSESMAGISTLSYSYKFFRAINTKGNKVVEWIFCIFQSYLTLPGIKTCGWTCTWDKITDLRNVSPEHGLC